MPAKSPAISSIAIERLTALGVQIRTRRKALRVSATALAEAAGISRVTLHRIENGEPSVTIGAYLNALAALDLAFCIVPSADDSPKPADDRAGWLPVRVRLVDYPQLKQLAWQVQGLDELTPREAWGIYERNWRHRDLTALSPEERNLIEALRQALGKRRAMFERPHHQRIARLLAALDVGLLRQANCLFGGGTAIALRYGEYRESLDVLPGVEPRRRPGF